jgi:hypothetical protein
MEHEQKIAEIIARIKIYFTNRNIPISEQEFLNVFVKYVDYVCGTESHNEIFSRLTNRLYTKMERDNANIVEKKSMEFYNALHNDFLESNCTNTMISIDQNKNFDQLVIEINNLLDNLDNLGTIDFQNRSTIIQQLIDQCQQIISHGDINKHYKKRYQDILNDLQEEFNQMCNICSNMYQWLPVDKLR